MQRRGRSPGFLRCAVAGVADPGGSEGSGRDDDTTVAVLTVGSMLNSSRRGTQQIYRGSPPSPIGCPVWSRPTLRSTWRLGEFGQGA